MNADSSSPKPGALAELIAAREALERSADRFLELESSPVLDQVDAAELDALRHIPAVKAEVERRKRAAAEVTPPPDPAALAETIELDGLPEGNGRRLLELEGFNVVRTGAIRVLQSLAGIPLETLEATIAYNQSAAARLKAAGPTSRDALAVAERELEYLRLVTRHRRELKTLEERLAARDRIVAR